LQIFGAATGTYRKLQNDIDHISAFDGTSETEGTFPDIHGSVELRNVSFIYPSRPETTVLRDVSFTFPEGKQTAIVGLSGSGKSTVAGLATRLYDPTSGTVFIDGQDVRSVNVRHLRSFISLVQQEPAILDRSILENIALGLVSSPIAARSHLTDLLLGPELAAFSEAVRKDPSQNILSLAETHSSSMLEVVKLVQQAAVLADAAGFIEGLQQGYGTIAGTSGRLLSGGQKQRIALARALVRDPKILILDEATASLDSHSEHRIMQAVQRIASGRTIISIAHRLSTVKNADNVIVMRDGQVLEQGTHEELMSRDGPYAELVNLQALSTVTMKDSVPAEATSSGKAAEVRFSSDRSQSEEDCEKSSPVAPQSEEEQEEEEAEGIPSNRSLWSILQSMGSLVRRDVLIILMALVGSVVVGGAFSGEAVIFGNTVGHLNPCNTPESIRAGGRFFGLMFFILALVEFFANLISWTGFGFVAERLLYRVRILSFRSLFEQSLGWHQSENRTPAVLLSLITRDGDALGGLSGSVVGTILSILINLVGAIALTHIIAWKIAIVCLSAVPLLLGAGLMELRILAKFEDRHENAYSKSVGIAVEAINSIKTVASFSLEQETMANYRRSLRGPRKETTAVTFHASLWLAMTYFVGTLSYALAFWWGSKQIIAGVYTPTQFLIVIMSLLVSAQMWSQMFALAPELSSARAAVARILNLLDIGSSRKLSRNKESSLSSIDPIPEKDVEALAESKSRIFDPAAGIQIAFRNVSFAYPTRPDAQILKGLDLEIRPGQFCALVGPSGAGKSTIISLVERMYVPSAGAIEIDGTDITRREDLTFRDEIALVPQDSALFEGTIKFNVALGARPNHEATDAEIEEACRLANIHETITGMPQGYDTQIGPNGGQLSGGQKQRLAIARALVRKPRLLILDESTSALDAESEKLLQDGLEKAARGITVLAIAHRLHTIKKADVIFLVEGGRCVDRGTHAELFERSDSYRVNATHQMFDGAES
jgi:ATP-binding cassette subfamily B (MDR/TAP) protein 1